MDSSLSPISSPQSLKYTDEALIIQTSLVDLNDDSIDVGNYDLAKGLAVSAQEILKKINELLGNSLPGGVQSLKPEDVTPEVTADRIVSGITGLFAAFAKQNPNLEGEELVSKFMEEARAGVEEGYSDAYSTLEGLGAFSFDGVQEGIEQTKILIEQKLTAFENAKKRELGVASDSTPTVPQLTSKGLITSAGGSIAVTA